MKKNPYSELLGIMNGVGRNNQSPTIQIGTILEPPPNIKVRYKSIILEAAECYISEYLLTQYKRSAEGNIKTITEKVAGGSGEAQYASHAHPVNHYYSESWITTDTLQPGDKVAIMPCESEDGTSQTYIILDKIVRPNRGVF